MREVDDMVAIGAELLLEEEGDGRFSVVLHYTDGTEERLPAVTPAEALIAAVETDYSDYRREVRRLWEERLNIPVADLEDFVAEALMLPSMLHEKDPVSFFVLGEFLHRSLQMEDDGSASFLLKAGQQILRILTFAKTHSASPGVNTAGATSSPGREASPATATAL